MLKQMRLFLSLNATIQKNLDCGYTFRTILHKEFESWNLQTIWTTPLKSNCKGLVDLAWVFLFTQAVCDTVSSVTPMERIDLGLPKIRKYREKAKAFQVEKNHE